MATSVVARLIGPEFTAITVIYIPNAYVKLFFKSYRKSSKNVLIDTDQCRKANPCQNAATCVTTGQFTYDCVCVAGYTGKNCEQSK